jgi:hypothetical protein
MSGMSGFIASAGEVEKLNITRNGSSIAIEANEIVMQLLLSNSDSLINP